MSVVANSIGDRKYTFIIETRMGRINFSNITKVVVKYNRDGLDFEQYLKDVKSLNADARELRVSLVYDYEIVQHYWDGQKWVFDGS